MDGFTFTILLFFLFVLLMAVLISSFKKRTWAVYLTAVTVTLSAWFAGLLLDANIDMEPAGFLSLRTLFPLLAMGLCVLNAVMKHKPD